MKRILALCLAVVMIFGALSGCAGGNEASEASITPEERREAYKSAIEAARDGEMNEAIPVITASSDQLADFVLPMLGITDDNAAAYAVSVSPINIKAYGLAAIMPAEGKDDEVLEGINQFVSQQKSNFENYLADQYQIASDTEVVTLDDGTILLVMSENHDTIINSIKTSLGQ